MAPDQTPGIGNPRGASSAGEFERLLIELRDFNDSVREKAAIRLGEIGKKEAIQPLIGRLNNDKSPQVQWQAADALYKIRDAQAWSAVQARLNARGDEKVRAKCAEILGLSGDKRFSQTLVQALGKEEEVAKQAAVGLGRLKDIGVLPNLIEKINNYSPYSYSPVFHFCAMAMTEIGITIIKTLLESSHGLAGDRYRVEALIGMGQPAVLHIALYLNNQDENIRSVAIQSLAGIRTEDSTKHLCNIVRTEKDPSLRMTALNEMEQRPAAQVENALIHLLQNDSDEYFKAKSAEIIGTLKIMAALDLLSKIALRDNYDNKKDETTKKAIKTLGLLGDPRAIPTVGSLLLDCADFKARKLSAEAIANINSNTGFDYLMSALGSDSNEEVRIASALALGQLRDQRAVNPLKQVSSSDPSSLVKEAAIKALKMI